MADENFNADKGQAASRPASRGGVTWIVVAVIVVLGGGAATLLAGDIFNAWRLFSASRIIVQLAWKVISSI